MNTKTQSPDHYDIKGILFIRTAEALLSIMFIVLALALALALRNGLSFVLQISCEGSGEC
jgi:hypothetical protein